jgi:long-chain acyl-CoA synthetase
MTARFLRGNLGDIIARAPHHPDAAYIDNASGTELSLADLEAQTASLTGGFSARFKRGDRVAIIARNGIAFTLCYLALMRMGAVPVPVNYRLPAETIAHILADSACKTALIDAEFMPLLPSGFPAIDLAGDAFASLCTSAPTESCAMLPGELCEILYTSGSTGLPKGVPLDHHGQLWALERFMQASGTDMQRTIIVAPAYHMNGLFFTTVALALGWRTLSMPAFDARVFLQLAASGNCTMLSGIPTMFAMMARETDLIETLDFSSVTSVTLGSAPLTQTLIDRVKAIFPAADLRNSYGTTESGPAIFGPHPAGLPRPSLALGYPYEGAEWRLEGLAANEGRLFSRTPAVLKEYLNLPAVSAERLNNGWYDTGDIVRHDDDGFFYFVGRADDMFVCGGENIYPGEVEKLIERHPDVLQAAVLPVNDDIKGAIPVAFVVRQPSAEVTADEIKQFTLKHGPAYAHPRAIEFLDTLPTGGTHKVDRTLLADKAQRLVAALSRSRTAADGQ